MPVARSVSASQLARGEQAATPAGGTPDEGEGGGGGGGPSILTQKAHTLDRFCNPSAMNGHAEPRRKRPFMSFRLSKKPAKFKDGGGGGGGGGVPSKGGEVSPNPNGVSETSSTKGSVVSEPGLGGGLSGGGSESVDGGSDSSSASVKPKKKYLTRMSSFVSRVASKVQGGGAGGPGSGGAPPSALSSGIAGVHGGGGGGSNRAAAAAAKLERSKTISASDVRSAKAEAECVVFAEGKVPGAMGIRNHGNTCFINAVVQCLSHTDVLAEYFVLDQYKHDLARSNKINSKKYGTRGEITGQLAVLLKALWTLRYVPDVSMNFKNTVDKYESSYRGSQQHDAAEFLMFVLDKVHEDLNTASKRKYKKIKNTYGRPDEVVAAETLANHLRCNCSFIHEIFQAQFRSSLKCPHCNKESNTFDPFLCVSIPIPQREVQAVFATVVYLNQQPKQVQLGVSIEANATIRELRKQLSEDCGISAESLILTEVDGEGFHRTFADDTSVNVISETDPVYAIELPPHKPPSQDSGAFILVTWVNVVLAEPDNIRFGGVYQSQVVRDVSYVDLQKLLLKEMTNMVTNETLTSEQESGLFLIGVDDGGSCVVCLDPALDVPLFHESVEQALALCEPSAGPPHVKLILQWTSETKEKYIIDDVDHMDVHASVKDLKENPQQCASVSLHQCLQLHTSAEKLGCGDAWHCPTCNRKQQVVKRLMLWSAPQILVIHLKRFRQGTLQSNSSKLSTTVKFPLMGFDISEHVASRTTGNNTQNNVDSGVLGGVWSPWKRPKRYVPHNEENVYDLYAVCNHHGKDMQGGHYTAVCKNSADDKWYNFDDSKVEVTADENVVTPDAYILFYQRRSESGHINNSCSEGGTEHWAYRIPLSHLPSTLIPQSFSEKKAPPPFERGRSYGTLPVNARTQRQSSTERDHASDTEAPLASHEESPILKRRSTNTLHEDEDSPSDEAPKSNLKIETIKVEVLPTQNGDVNMECENSISSAPDSDQEMPDVQRNSPGKTVLISRCQALRDQDLEESVDASKPEPPVMNGHAEPEVADKATQKNEDSPLPSPDKCEDDPNHEEQTPEVRIHPATPEVLAAHQGHTAQTQPKRSVITLTLRPRNPSESSSGGTPEPRIRVVSRTPSMVSSCSTSSNASGPIVNGVDYSHLNGSVEEPNRDIIYNESSNVTPEVRITPIPKNFEAPTSLHPTRMSTRSTNTNKTPSFVVINTPTASPRAPRPKTPVSNGISTSPRPPFAPKFPSKPREPPSESYKNQRPSASRKENGVLSRQAIVSGRNSNAVPSVSYCAPVKNNLNGISTKHSRYDRVESKFSREGKSERGEYMNKREDRYDREHSMDRDSRSDRDHKFERCSLKAERDGKYDRESRYERELKYKRDSRYENDHSIDRDLPYEKEIRYDRDFKCDRDSRYDRECMYERDIRCDRDYKYERESKCDRDFLYDRDAHCDREYKYSRDTKCTRDFSYDRDLLYERDSKFDRDYRYDRGDPSCDRDYKYEDSRYDRDYKYEREESKCIQDFKYDRGEMNGRRSICKTPEHCISQDYPKGLTNTANPPVITESSV
ncbi:ubiquitin carboxyl-terminal hydrolase 31-like [Penaeus chinensis]|uniref:ubiquitin carboxyl-terminal hydrolase 31-like n=1 Tax=Penaeus chinensis TaxID=139456 RepID=UPI001FB74D8F|nr:ubiquitin carboxyl-terminal hydrolase 31-like [Penaeus chinensis]